MSGTTPSPSSFQQQYLDAIREGQEAFANAIRAWSETTQRMFGDAAPAAAGQMPDPEQVIDTVFGFAEQMLAAQRDFAKRLVGAASSAASTTSGTTTP